MPTMPSPLPPPAASATGAWNLLLQPILARTGYVLPALFLTLLILILLYPDRVIGTSPYRPGIPVLPAPKSWPNGGKGSPLIGHTYLVIRGGTKGQFERIMELSNNTPQGVFQSSMLGLGNRFLFLRPEYIETLQKTQFENFVKGPMFRSRFEDVLGTHGIFVADGETWKLQRKRASHIFSRGQFTNWVQTVVDGELKLVRELLDRVAVAETETTASGTSGKNKVVLTELFYRYTLSSFSKMAYSADLDCLSASPACLDTPVPFAVAFDVAQAVINERFIYPFFQIHERFTERGRQMRAAVKQLRKSGLDIITDRIAARKAQDAAQAQGQEYQSTEKRAIEKDGKDLLDLFLDLTKDPDDLLQIVMNFLIAGRDTTAQSLSWLFVELFSHPEHIDEMRKEIDTVCNGGLLRYDDFKNLPYTQACVAEAIRLHPAVPKNGKFCVQDTVVHPAGPNPDNLPSVLVKKGEGVGWCDWVMARRTDVWGPDAAEYKPERFLETDPATGKRTYISYSAWKFHAFNGMPRLCLGMNLAFFEAMAFCVATLPHFDFTFTSKEDGQSAQWPPTYLNSVTHPSEPYYATIRKRR